MDILHRLKFKSNERNFISILNARVNAYFQEHQISRHANLEMVIKTIVMFLLYFGSFGLVLSGQITGSLTTILLMVVMGVGLVGIGVAVMHDGNHGAYSGRKWVNTLMGYSLNLIGASSFNWKVQHNIFHHTHTNVYQHDEDVSAHGLLRFTPHSPWKWYHSHQHFYAWFFYGFMTIFWMFYKDFIQLRNYQQRGLIRERRTSPIREWTILILTKVFYVSYIFILPLLLTSWVWWQILLGIFIMHFVTGFLLAIIFQSAHVIIGSAYPLPDPSGQLEDTWAIHQLRTTSNFAIHNRWLTWASGGLNFQVEHHLFPSICHVHYPQLSSIIKATADEFNLPYRCIPTFLDALSAHYQQLIQLGHPTLQITKR